MGIDYDGNMMVGVYGNDIDFPDNCEDEYEWIEENGLDVSRLYYDADVDGSFIGYIIGDIIESELDYHIKEVGEAFVKMKEYTKAIPRLVGVQNIW